MINPGFGRKKQDVSVLDWRVLLPKFISRSHWASCLYESPQNTKTQLPKHQDSAKTHSKIENSARKTTNGQDLAQNPIKIPRSTPQKRQNIKILPEKNLSGGPPPRPLHFGISMVPLLQAAGVPPRIGDPHSRMPRVPKIPEVSPL